MEDLPTDFFVTTSAYTPTVHRDQYPTINPRNPEVSQAGKVVIITGASSGIGARGFAPAFAKAGPKAIVLVGRNIRRLKQTEEVIRAINPNVEYISVPTDLTDPASVDRLFRLVRSRYGHADVLVNNAGTFSPSDVLGNVDPNAWWSDFEINVKGTFLATRGFLSLLGFQRQGKIITLSTSGATAVFPGLSAYSISKLGALKIAEYVAAEYSNVTSIAMQPGTVMTEMVIGGSTARPIDHVLPNAHNPDSFKRFALDTPELVGGTGVWLASDAANFLTGRFVSANWSVDDLVKKKDAILASNDLKLIYQGRFGLDQFK
ncbi:hypothetical protein LTR84_004323 [Exophiala bonariae]|uniref:NAD(P)-binding protein n=1 Tax=Exophiala bonariae TaxID=1690606 RepID=A0AAV9N4L4_9EURO|nr:hypothetical protein LTR84_004323 [Exophiala bonariae]